MGLKLIFLVVFLALDFFTTGLLNGKKAYVLAAIEHGTPLPEGVTGLDQFRVQRRDRAGGVIHEYRLVA